jgi:hypothetical protein
MSISKRNKKQQSVVRTGRGLVRGGDEARRVDRIDGTARCLRRRQGHSE